MSDVRTVLSVKLKRAFSTSGFRDGDLRINQPGRAIVRSFLWWLMTIGFLCLPVGLLCQQLAISVLKGNSIIRDLSLLLMNYVWFALLTLYPGLVLMMMSAFGTAKVPPGTDSTTARD